MPDMKTYTLAEIAQILQLSRRTLYNYLKDGRLKAIKVGKEWRVTEKQLAELLERGTERTPIQPV